MVTEVFHWDDIPPYGDAKADRRLIPGGGGDLKRVRVAAGTVADRHEHDFEQFFLVVAGEGVLTCGLGEIRLRPGVVVHFAPNEWHSAVFDTATELVEVNFCKLP